jgi:mono/diheme cytochrome c family protein
MRRNWLLVCCVGMTALLVRSAIAQDQARSQKSANTSVAAMPAPSHPADTHDGAAPSPATDAAFKERMARLEGEKRFRTNCGRCHQPPHKFPPRVMATAIRHMRVRAMITDEDMRLILKYLTE